MTEPALAFDERLHSLLKIMAEEGTRHAAEGLSGMLGKTVTVSHSEVSLIPLAALPAMLGGPENDAVGIYLQTSGDMAGQMMLVVPYAQALELADLLLGLPLGTSQQLGALERSALAEVGNLTGSFFLNAVASHAGVAARPSPPAVMVDMVGAIIDIIVATCGSVRDQILMIQSHFAREGREVHADFWVIPDDIAGGVHAESEGDHAGSGG